MKLPIWFKKSNGGYFYIPVHWAGWLCYIISFGDITVSFFILSEGTTNTTEQFRAVLPVVLLNFIVLAVVIFLTSEKREKEK